MKNPVTPARLWGSLVTIGVLTAINHFAPKVGEFIAGKRNQ